MCSLAIECVLLLESVVYWYFFCNPQMSLLAYLRYAEESKEAYLSDKRDLQMSKTGL